MSCFHFLCSCFSFLANFNFILFIIFSEKNVRDHLKAVYGTLCVGLITAAIGAAVHICTDILRANFLLALAPIGFMLALCATPHTVENERKRFLYFLGFTGLTGKMMFHHFPCFHRFICVC